MTLRPASRRRASAQRADAAVRATRHACALERGPRCQRARRAAARTEHQRQRRHALAVQVSLRRLLAVVARKLRRFYVRFIQVHVWQNLRLVHGCAAPAATQAAHATRAGGTHGVRTGGARFERADCKNRSLLPECRAARARGAARRRGATTTAARRPRRSRRVAARRDGGHVKSLGRVPAAGLDGLTRRGATATGHALPLLGRCAAQPRGGAAARVRSLRLRLCKAAPGAQAAACAAALRRLR